MRKNIINCKLFKVNTMAILVVLVLLLMSIPLSAQQIRIGVNCPKI